jgi:hypothetical protein
MEIRMTNKKFWVVCLLLLVVCFILPLIFLVRGSFLGLIWLVAGCCYLESFCVNQCPQIRGLSNRRFLIYSIGFFFIILTIPCLFLYLDLIYGVVLLLMWPVWIGAAFHKRSSIKLRLSSCAFLIALTLSTGVAVLLRVGGWDRLSW